MATNLMIRFAPGTKRADGGAGRKSNVLRRRHSRKKNTSTISGDDDANANNTGNAGKAKQQIKVKTK